MQPAIQPSTQPISLHQSQFWLTDDIPTSRGAPSQPIALPDDPSTPALMVIHLRDQQTQPRNNLQTSTKFDLMKQLILTAFAAGLLVVTSAVGPPTSY